MNKLLFSCLIILFITISIEVLLRTFFPLNQSGNISNYKYDKDLGIKLKEELNDIKITDHRQEVFTNKYGTLNYEDNFSKYDKLIFTIGDSNTQGVGVPFDSSYPFILYTELNSLDNDNWGVINLALASYGTKQALLIYELSVEKFKKPDFVTYLADKNDYMSDNYFERGDKHKHLVHGSPRFFGLAKYLGIVSNEIEIMKRTKYLINKKNIDTNYHKKEKNFKKLYTENYSKKIININNKLKKEGITFIYSWNDIEKDKNKICKTEYNFVKKWASDNKVKFADWCPTFLKITQLNNDIPVLNEHSASHARSWINRIISNSFREEILNLN